MKPFEWAVCILAGMVAALGVYLALLEVTR